MADWDMTHLIPALTVLVPIACGLAALWQRATADMRRSADWRARVDERLSDMDGRLAALERLRGPTHEDMQRISAGVSNVDGRLARVEGELGGLRSGLELIHEHLLRGAGGASGE